MFSWLIQVVVVVVVIVVVILVVTVRAPCKFIGICTFISNNKSTPGTRIIARENSL